MAAMEATPSENSDAVIATLISSIPHYFKSPPPQPLPDSLSDCPATVPADSRIPRQPPLLDISLQLSVSPTLYFQLIPRIYPTFPLPTPAIDDLYSQSQDIAITNTPAIRSLLHHSLYGIFTPSTPQHLSIARNIIAANLHALSTSLSRVPTFVISLEPSPYFGATGLEARIVLSPTAPTTSPPTFHLLGVSVPEVCIPNLEFLLKQICPQFKHRLLGVIANLTSEQHKSPLGVIASRVIVHFMRIVSRGPFITPDLVLSPPPLTPAKLALLTREDITKLVAQYRPRLEHYWNQEIFKAVVKENEELRTSHRAFQKGGEGMLEHAWALVGDQYPNLRMFIASLATAFAYKPAIRTKVPITTQDSTDLSFAAEFALQARQFVLLRKLLVT